MTLDELVHRITQLIRDADLQDSVLVERRTAGNGERVQLTRRLNSGVRYLRIAPVAYADRTWDFEILGGAYGNANPNKNFDGRRGGDASYVLNVVKRWLIDLANWDDIPPSESRLLQ